MLGTSGSRGSRSTMQGAGNPRSGTGIETDERTAHPVSPSKRRQCVESALPCVGCLTSDRLLNPLSLRYPLERRSAAPTFLGLLRGLGKMMHAKLGAYFLSELFVGVRLKYAVCIFGH